METIEISTTRRTAFADITQEIEKIIHRKRIKEGVCVIFCPHTTAALTINENADPAVKKDITGRLGELIPEGEGYSHSEGNADAHIKSSLLGSSLNIIIEEGRLALGTWQGVYFCEFDGPRKRALWLKIVKG